MTQLGEAIALGTTPQEYWKCPFDHSGNAEPEKLPSEMEPWEKSDSDKLGRKLEARGKSDKQEYHLKKTDIMFRGKKVTAQFTPHHLIPGPGSWVDSKLRKWVDKRDNHIKENIGYELNESYNGVSLPSRYGISDASWNALDETDKQQYAFKCMEALTPLAQFHIGGHEDYNDFVLEVLDKIAEKLDSKIKDRKYPGCDQENCAGMKRQRKPYDPPIHLLKRLESVALRLERYLIGSPIKNWREPIILSNYARMYKKEYRNR